MQEQTQSSRFLFCAPLLLGLNHSHFSTNTRFPDVLVKLNADFSIVHQAFPSQVSVMLLDEGWWLIEESRVVSKH